MNEAETSVRTPESDLERVRRCLAEAGIDPNLAMLTSRSEVGVDTTWMGERETRLVWRAFRLVAPDETPDYELWKCSTTREGDDHER